MLEGQQSSHDPVALSAMADRAGGLLGSRGGLGERVSGSEVGGGPFWCHGNSEIFSKLVFPLKVAVVS